MVLDLSSAKARVAKAGADLVQSGMVVGLGSGTTSALMVEFLGERIRNEGLSITTAATSEATAELARKVGIQVVDLDHAEALHLSLDGADEIDPQFAMIKGRGGALLREKIVAAASHRRVTLITAEKRVERLGVACALPIEVSLFGLSHTERRLRRLGAVTQVRKRAGELVITDGGNGIIDCKFEAIDDPRALDQTIQGMPGVLETGLFVGLCDVLIVGYADRVEILESDHSKRAVTG